MNILAALRHITENEECVARPIQWQEEDKCVDYINGEFNVITLDNDTFPCQFDEIFGEWETLLFDDFLSSRILISNLRSNN